MLPDFAQSLVRELALPALSRGYGELVAELRSNTKLAERARAVGLDALLTEGDPALAALKKDNKELVTQAEKIAERAMTDAVRQRFPTHTVLGEEHGLTKGDATCWVFDPVDGTSAMIRTAMSEAFGLPLPTPAPAFGVTVALVENGTPTLGIVAQLIPTQGGLTISRLFMGGKNIPATCNQLSLALPACPASLAGAQLACTVPEVMFGTREKWSGFQALLDATGKPCLRDQNCVGFMQLLSGEVDMAYEADLAYHDAAALIPILEAAGITVSDGAGKPLSFAPERIGTEFQVLAAQSVLHAQAVAKIAAGVPPEQNRFAPHNGGAQGYANKFPV